MTIIHYFQENWSQIYLIKYSHRHVDIAIILWRLNSTIDLSSLETLGDFLEVKHV